MLKLNGLLVDDFSPLPVSSGVVGTSGVKDHYDARAISLSRLSGTESTPSLWLKSCISEPQLQESDRFLADLYEWPLLCLSLFLPGNFYR